MASIGFVFHFSILSSHTLMTCMTLYCVTVTAFCTSDMTFYRVIYDLIWEILRQESKQQASEICPYLHYVLHCYTQVLDRL